MEWIKNQPVYFGESDTCSDDPTIIQLVDNTDSTQVQFTCEPCSTSPQLIDDPNFSTDTGFSLGAGWIIQDGLLCKNSPPLSVAISNYSFDETKYYQVNINVSSISPGSTFNVSLGLGELGIINSVGSYTFYAFPITILGTHLLISPQTEDAEICISEITAYEVLTNAIIAVYSSDGTYQNEISYANTPDNFTFSKNTVTATIDWSELGISNGCYYLCFLDPCVNTNNQNYSANIVNGTFSNDDNWDSGGDVTFNGGSVTLDTEVINEGFFLNQDNVFNSLESEFCVIIDVEFVLAGGLNFSFGFNQVATITTSGTHTITGTPSGDFALRITNLAETTCTINSITACPFDTDNYTCNLTSNTFKLADYSQDCTLIINACNNEDGLGFVFENSGFSPRIRLDAKLRQAKYPSELSSYRDSKGKDSVTYFDGRKAKNLCIDLQPEYVHDFLRLLLGFDNKFINGIPYSVVDDEYNVEYPEEFDGVGKVRLLVSERTQNLKNINATGTESVCNLPPDYLLKSDQLTDYITLSNGELILING